MQPQLAAIDHRADEGLEHGIHMVLAQKLPIWILSQILH